jgi:hypothetical protein
VKEHRNTETLTIVGSAYHQHTAVISIITFHKNNNKKNNDDDDDDSHTFEIWKFH